MTTATDTDLSWVTFSSGDHGENCQWRACRAEATHAGIFATASACPHTRVPYCLPHGEMIVRRSHLGTGLFNCYPCGPGARLRLIRMEPLP